MATCAGSPQVALRACGSNKCPIHYGKDIVFCCKNCDKLVCTDCAIQECQGHAFEGISNVIAASKQKLQDFITEVELTEIPIIQGKVQAADCDLTKNKNHFNNQIRKLRRQNEAIKKELDKITETFVKTYQGMELQNLEELLDYKRDLQTRIDKLASQIQNAKGTLQSGNDILVFDMSRVIRTEFKDLPKLFCNTPEFNPATCSVQELEQLLGTLNIPIDTQSLNQPEDWTVMSEFKPYTEHAVESIHAPPAARDQAWISFYNTDTNEQSVEKMLLIDESGQVKQTLDMDVSVFDFSLSPITGDIWFSSQQDNSVRKVKAGKSIIRFTTDTNPRCLCVTKDDHVVIGFHGQVVKYTQGGQVICATAGGTPPLVRTPWHFSECPLTSHIAVVDRDWQKDGGNGKRIISILNDQLQLLYTYAGEKQGQISRTRPFCPYDVCFTFTGELVITDSESKSLVLVTGTGRYLTTLNTNSKSEPYAVCEHSGKLWVSFVNGSVQVLKHT